MKNLIIPGPITLVDDDDRPYKRAKKGAEQPSPQEQQMGAKPILEDDSYTFWTWLRTFVLTDEKFNKSGWDAWEQIARIKQIKLAKEGDLVLVDDDDVKLMAEIARKPSGKCYRDGLIAVQFALYIKTLITADESKPAKPVADAVAEEEAA